MRTDSWTISLFGVETATTKLEKYKLPCIDYVPVELIQAEGETLWIWESILKELPDQWKSLLCPNLQERS
jgi:hypothetical protein